MNDSISVPHIHLPDGSCCRPKRFAHLHQHTQYSLLDGAAKIKELIQWAKEITPQGQAPAIAMTDHGNMHGAVRFYMEAEKQGVKPILGYEAYVIPGYGTRRDRKSADEKSTFHLTLLARDFEGYQNLCRLSSLGYTEGYYYKPRIDHELLEEYSKGIIAMSGCLGSEVQQLLLQNRPEEAKERLLWYRQIFGDNYFIEIQNHGLLEQEKNNPILKQWAHELGIGMVATNDGHYVEKKDAEMHDALLAIQTKATLDQENRFRFPCDEFYVKNLEEMQEALPVEEWGEEVFDNTMHIADLCNVELPVGSKRVYQMPALPIPKDRTMAQELRLQTYQGMLKRYPIVTEEILSQYAQLSFKLIPSEHKESIQWKANMSQEELCFFLAKLGSIWQSISITNNEEYIQYPALDQLEKEETLNKEVLTIIRRAEYELGVIINMKFPDYFLIVSDYIKWAKNQGISVGPGRGSGAGSLVAYALLITNIDPLEFDLLFERFLNPNRISMPDFDIDFHDVRRAEVIDYVRRTYGNDKVAMIATFGTMASKSAFKDVARVMKLNLADTNKITKLIPVKQGKSFSLSEAEKAVPDLRIILDSHPNFRKAYDAAKELEGLTRNSGTHAAGVVIGRESLTNLVPIMRDSKGEMLVCQYDMKSVEEVGLIKMDFLGLRTLSFLDEAKRILNESETDFSRTYKSFDEIPFDDEKTFELISRGDTKGVFQLEGAGITDAARKLKPKALSDIIALSALYRPGPMENIPTYVRRHHGIEEVSYEQLGFPSAKEWLEPILEETYGIPVYQEQIMQISSDVGGFSLGRADLLRRAMGKKDRAELESMRGEFVKGAAEKNIPVDEANRLFDMLESFAEYGFNKSHSAAYGVISYQTAWLKANYPVQFMAALLTVERGDSNKLSEYISDARKMNLRVLPPDINHSSNDFSVVNDEILFGLYAIKGLGEEVVLKILEERKNKGLYQSMEDFCIRVGAHIANRKAMENLILSGALDQFGERKQLVESLEEFMQWAQDASQVKKSTMPTLFDMCDMIKAPTLKQVEPYEKIDRLFFEKQVLGMYISGHPLEYHEELREATACRISDLDYYFEQHQKNNKLRIILSGAIEKVEIKQIKSKTKSSKKSSEESTETPDKKASQESSVKMARFIVSDQSGQIELVVFSRGYERLKDKLKENTTALIIIDLESQDGGLRAVADNIILPDELKGIPKVMYLDIDLKESDSYDLNELHSVLDEHAGHLRTYFRLSDTHGSLLYELTHPTGGTECMQQINESFSWVRASLGYDQQSVLHKFAQAPWTWKREPATPSQPH